MPTDEYELFVYRESPLHLQAKRILAEHLKSEYPEATVATEYVICSRIERKFQLTDGRPMTWQECCLAGEKPLAIADIVLARNGMIDDVFEVVVTNRPSQRKVNLYKAHGMRLWVIDAFELFSS